ncbi:MAG TPA: FAD-binding protein, partial [Gemmatimonadales bacterium]|nr:FAD-binding protein [Gemmatimonadales bacterium]
MSFHTARLLRDAIGVEGVYRTADCTVHAVPADREALVGAMRVAGSHGFFAASSGSGSWQVLDGPQDIELSLRAMNRVIDVRPADMVMTVEAGATIETLRRVALDHDTWLALDPPGNPGRTIGSVLATATSGPLRHGFGGVREQVLGLTAVTVPARVMHAGGTTVKNVAG